MKTDSILEELYQVRAAMMRKADNNFDKLFDQMRVRHQAYEALHPEVKWVDFSKQRRAGAEPRV
jgi:hypothetical protein